MTDVKQLIHAWLEVMPQGDFDAFPGEVSADFVLFLPFVPPGIPNAFHGRETAREALASNAKGRSKLAFSNVVVLVTEDPELVVVTAQATATMANGRPYSNQYVIMIRIRDGMILEHTEYLNPLALVDLAVE